MCKSPHLQIPCRTAMRGSFPLNGTYFQVNEVRLIKRQLLFSWKILDKTQPHLNGQYMGL